MAQKRKAGDAAKKAVAADKQKAQSARFIKTAREHGIDETGKEFDQAMKKIVSSKKS